MILIDTSVLIEYFRKQKKEETFLFQLIKNDDELCISAITKYEIIVGNSPKQEAFWENVLVSLKVLEFGDREADKTALIYKELKKKNKLIGFADIAIAATAFTNQMQLATLNIKHFRRIDKLEIVEKKWVV